MRRMQGFQAASIRPYRRLAHACRHIVAASLQTTTVGTHGAFALHSAHARALTTASSSPLQGPEARSSLSETWSGREGPTVDGQSIRQAGVTHAPVSSRPTSLLTLELVEAFVRRHDHLCSDIFLFATSPSLAASYAATQSLFTAPPSTNPSVDGNRLDASAAAVQDGEQRHSARAFHVTEDELRSIRAMLDRLSQESHVLGALAYRQRHRLVTEVCRIGYVVGLHRRSCALYVDAVLLLSSPPPPASTASSSSSSSSSSTASGAALAAAEASPLPSIPEFVMDAAGEAADLSTLMHCLAYAARAMGEEDAHEMSPGWLAAVNVFVQCVRVAMQHQWQCRAEAGASAVVVIREEEEEEEKRGGASAACSTDALDDTEENRWYRFTLQVLQVLRIDAAESFYRATLRSARYHFVDAGGEWAAAQAAVYARCFRRWLGEEDVAALPLSAAAAAVVQRTQASSPKRLSCPALVLLLRTAVAARQSDIAEWATLYVDTGIAAWVAEDDVPVPSAAAAAAAAPPASTTATAQLETLLVWYLRHLQQSSQRRRACDWLRRLRTLQVRSPRLTTALQALPLVRAAARLAGEENDAELALWSLQLCLSEAPGLAPTHADIFACLRAVARCGLPTFEMVLQSLQGNGLLQPTAEELLYVRLLHARHSPQWRSAWEQCMTPYVVFSKVQDGTTSSTARSHPRSAALPHERDAWSGARQRQSVGEGSREEEEEEDGAGREHHGTAAASAGLRVGVSRLSSSADVFTARVMHLALLLLQEGEHSDFMSLYRAFLQSFSERVTVNDRTRWAVLALSWARARQGQAPLEDVVYIVREVDQLMVLQAGHITSRGGRREAAVSSSTPASLSSSSRSLPISEELHRSLQRRWAELYQLFAPTWWSAIASGSARDGSSHVRTSHSPYSPPLLEPVLLQRMVSAARTATANFTTPAVARFVRRRHHLPAAHNAAADTLVSSVHSSVSWHGGLPLHGAAVLGQRDRELWAAYVASVVEVR